MADVTLRKLQTEDVPRVIEILSYWNMAPVVPSAAVPIPERSEIATDGRTTVALVDKKIVGVASYILLDESRAETASLAVDPAWRGKGVGEQLQITRLKELKARGVRLVVTECDRPEVVDWYLKKFKYRIVRTEPKRHPFGRLDVNSWTVLELDLTNWRPEGQPKR